ncbi:hypothetical protein [Nonomuraea sp. NPDC048826]|uniref:hypothetical protein n=1 Tax=Nonomuraea sp. NPDC048826 TaxID=3364347 RepID=UPI00371B17A6
MTATEWRFTSPLSLLNDWHARADQAPLHELVLLGFTMDLPFLEQVAIPTARGLGARIIVVGDAGQGLYDPIDVRLAGSSYLHSLATCAGAFHPKLALLVGENDVWMAIGSGNPTVSGWGSNDELWTVIVSSGGLVSHTIAEAGTWLRRLADTSRLSMTHWAAELLREVAADISARPFAVTDLHVRLLDNLDEAFVHQLSAGPVDELCLYAPFISGEAIRALIHRLEPLRTTLAVQPRWTSYDGDALLDALGGQGVELRFLEEKHLRHGKLIQWRVGEQLYGLIGSPNLTRSALCMATAEGGNCELALMAPLPENLMPNGAAKSPEALAGHSTVRRRYPSPSLVLLGALVHSKGLEVTLARPQPEATVIHSSPDGAPGSWQPIGIIPPGEIALVLTVPEAPGSVIRAERTLPDGRIMQSPPVFAASPARCARRIAEAQGPRLRREYTVEEIFTDPELARRFNADLIRLAEILPRATSTRPAPGKVEGNTVRSVIEDRWTAHLEECDRVYGSSFTGLIYGPIAAALPASSRLSRWSATTSVVDESDEEEKPPESSPVPKIAPSQYAAYQRWADRWVQAVTRPGELSPLPLRMLMAGIYVKLLAAGVWDHSNDSWRQALSRLTKALVPTAGIDALEESTERLCAVTAVCTALLAQDLSLTGGRPDELLAASVWAKVKPLIAKADLDLGEDLLLPPVQPRARVVSRNEVQRLINLAADDDPLAEMKAEIDSAGWEITDRNGLWEITGNFTNPTPVATRVATTIGATGRPAVVLARTSTRWTLIAWRPPELVLLSDPGRAWRTYRITPPASPTSRFASADIASVPGRVGTAVHMSQAPPESARQVFADCGFDALQLRDYAIKKQSMQSK